MRLLPRAALTLATMGSHHAVKPQRLRLAAADIGLDIVCPKEGRKATTAVLDTIAIVARMLAATIRFLKILAISFLERAG